MSVKEVGQKRGTKVGQKTVIIGWTRNHRKQILCFGILISADFIVTSVS
jgi:hypothetical protein